MAEGSGGGVYFSRAPPPPHRQQPQQPLQQLLQPLQQPQSRPPSRSQPKPRPFFTPRCGGCEKAFKFDEFPIKGVPPRDRRLPLSLDCGHTRCEECAQSDFRPGKGVACDECAHVTPLVAHPGDNLSICVEQLPLDYYVFGILSERILAPKRYPPFGE